MSYRKNTSFSRSFEKEDEVKFYHGIVCIYIFPFSAVEFTHSTVSSGEIFTTLYEVVEIKYIQLVIENGVCDQSL